MKGIDPRAREAAKDLARRSGMTLGEWLNQVILEDSLAEQPLAPPPMAPPLSRRPTALSRMETRQHPGDEVYRVTEALDRLSNRIEAAEDRTASVVGGVDQSVAELVARLDAMERENTILGARFETAMGDVRLEQSRVGDRLRDVERNLAEPGAALRSLESALAKVANQLYETETQTHEALGSLRQDVDGLSARMEAGPDAAAVIDSVVARIGERLERAESRTSAAIRSLESSFGQLEQRLQVAEGRLEERGGGLDTIAASLQARVDAARAEMAEKLSQSAEGRFDRMERALQDMNTHVQGAERRSADAIERMGHEVLRMADALNRTVRDVERRSADAISKVGGDVTRIADAVEARFSRADNTGAQALEKLGGEIARITERLAERIANAERRSAQAIDDVGEQLSRVTDKLQERQERTSSDLAERIRQSEERTARLLEGARERIDQSLVAASRRVADAESSPAADQPAESFDPDVAPFGHAGFRPPEPFTAAAPPPAFTADDFGAPAEPFAPEPFAPDSFSPAAFTADAFAAEPFTPAPPPAENYDPPSFESEPFSPEPFVNHPFEDDFDAAPFVAPPAFEPSQAEPVAVRPPPAEPIAPEPAVAPAIFAAAPGPRYVEASEADVAMVAGGPAPAEPAAPSKELPPLGATPPKHELSTRELVQQARAAAKAAAQASETKGRNGKKDPSKKGFSLGFGKPKRGGPSAMTAALMISGGAAVLSLGGAGYIMLADQPSGPLPSRVAESLGGGHGVTAPPEASTNPQSPQGGDAVPPEPSAGSDQSGAPPLAAMAIAPGEAMASAGTDGESGTELYADAVRRIETRDFSGVDALRRAANLGYPPAEFYLAKLYETGEAGVNKDLTQARRWTERAADAGDRKAMHNLALYYVEGAGGPKNTTTAAQWFRRAADLGLIDSQYNLGRLYEEGFGVAQNPAEAYKWYLIAARSGDAESRASAQRLKTQLSAEAQASAERAAAAFQALPQPSFDSAGQAAAPQGAAATIAAQQALSRLGYYQGPTDGSPSPALKLAIAAYQRDQGLPATGVVDAALSQRLAQIAQ